MSNIIDLASRRNSRLAKFKSIIEMVLSRNQSLIIGTDRRQEKYNELHDMFPEAELEIVGLGVKIWKK